MGAYLEANEVEVMVHSLRRQNIATRAKRSNKGSYRAWRWGEGQSQGIQVKSMEKPGLTANTRSAFEHLFWPGGSLTMGNENIILEYTRISL